MLAVFFIEDGRPICLIDCQIDDNIDKFRRFPQ